MRLSKCNKNSVSEEIFSRAMAKFLDHCVNRRRTEKQQRRNKGEEEGTETKKKNFKGCTGDSCSFGREWINKNQAGQ